MSVYVSRGTSSYDRQMAVWSPADLAEFIKILWEKKQYLIFKRVYVNMYIHKTPPNLKSSALYHVVFTLVFINNMINPKCALIYFGVTWVTVLVVNVNYLGCNYLFV